MTTALASHSSPATAGAEPGGDTAIGAAVGENTASSAAVGEAGATRHPAGRPYLTAVPDCEPPFDDERSARSRIEQLRRTAGSAARSKRARAMMRTAAPVLSPPTAGQPALIREADVPGWSQDPDIGVRRTATADLPVAERSARMLARALVEVISGQRPVAQLRVHCAPEVFAGLSRRPIRQGALGHLMNVHVCQPADGVAEVSAVFRRGERVRALAFRLQGVDGRWRVTALQTV